MGASKGHFIIIIKDIEKQNFYALTKVDGSGNLVKVAGPDGMPFVLTQNLIEKLLKYNTTAKKLEEIKMKAIGSSIVAVTLAVKKKIK